MSNRDVVKYIIGIFLCVLGIIILFGSLLISALTNNSLWFIVGYPVSTILLIISLLLYKNLKVI